jgi:secreted PhoX family phosphatase
VCSAAGTIAMNDNIAWQSGRGNWTADLDTVSDGCIRIGTLNHLNAEWTGGFFEETGRRFFVSIQHNVTGHGMILEVTGWR